MEAYGIQSTRNPKSETLRSTFGIFWYAMRAVVVMDSSTAPIGQALVAALSPPAAASCELEPPHAPKTSTAAAPALTMATFLFTFIFPSLLVGKYLTKNIST
jgi:hypothetical protein